MTPPYPPGPFVIWAAQPPGDSAVRSNTVIAVSFLIRIGFRLMIENMPNISTAHEVLAVVFQVRQLSTPNPQLSVLLWERAMDPQRGAWSLPGGRLRHDEDMRNSVRRQLAEKVDLRELTHLEQLEVFSDP